jgi:murein DD-endopeptidase MepM/ murein hydrolase activator NlpD
MHLSKMNVRAGELVGRETKIGLSGETGYALSPHLHLSIKISGVSIDPARFLEFFKQS